MLATQLLREHQAVGVRGFKYLFAWKLFTFEIHGTTTIGEAGLIRDEVM